MQYTDKDLTQWFDLKDQRPWEPGVYEVESTETSKIGCSYWDGVKFCHAIVIESREDRIYYATRWMHVYVGEWEHKIIRWRGLSSNPNAPKPKPKRNGNKKVTRYVVIDRMEIDKPVGCFKNAAVAEKFAKRFKWAEVEKIRFRTPEAA